jgi:hypothetical protein
MRASLKRADIEPAQRVICPACSAFVEVVGGIRGPAFREGRRHFYTLMGSPSVNTTTHVAIQLPPMRGSRCGPRYGVSRAFFPGVCNACGHWVVDHLAFVDDPRAHLANQELPPWVPSLIREVDFGRKVSSDAAITVGAALLGISRQQTYARLAALNSALEAE